MNLKSEKGYTGIDIATSVIVLFIFISLIASLSYRFNSSAKEIELKAEATQVAVQEIQALKNSLTFEAIKEKRNNYEYQNEKMDTGFLKRVLIQDYADIDSSKQAGYVKKVTVEVQYYYKKPQQISLSTIVSKES